MITNPFTNSDFASLQLKSGKAKQIFKLKKDHFAYLYPLFKNYNILYATHFSKHLNKIAHDNNTIYTLIESYQPVSHPTKNPIKQIVPRHTIAIDLRNTTEDELLTKMHPKGRYNIKLATKKGVTIKQVFKIDEFYKILKETAERDGFFINSKKYYSQFLNQLNSKLFMAYYNDKPIAGILNAYFDHTAIYYYGASSNEFRNLMAPYLLQWHGILDAKENGYHFYDFLGVADPKNPKDPLKGVTYFKQKFGGTMHVWPESRILVHKPVLYYLLKLKKLLKI